MDMTEVTHAMQVTRNARCAKQTKSTTHFPVISAHSVKSTKTKRCSVTASEERARDIVQIFASMDAIELPDCKVRKRSSIYPRCRKICRGGEFDAGALLIVSGAAFEYAPGMRESTAEHPGPDPKQAFWKCPFDDILTAESQRSRCFSQSGEKRARLC